jgi:hypothetical protein
VPRALGATDIATAENSATVTIMIGSARPHHVVAASSPSVLADARSATIVANVYDEFGNPVQNVPVFFAVTAWTPAIAPQVELLDSGGSPRHTDANGQAFDTLRTRSATGTTPKTVTVTATTATGETDPVDVVIYYSATPPR